MHRSGKRFIWAIFFFLLVSCTAKKEELLPPPPPPPPPPPAAAPLPLPPTPPRLEVVQLRMAANREFVGVRIRLARGTRLDSEATEAYLIDEATGEKFPVVRLQRIGRMAEFSVPGEKDIRHVMFRNREGKLRIGSRVTVVIGNTRQEHLVVQK